MSGVWKKTLKRFVHDVRGLAKDEEVAKVTKAVAETAKPCSWLQVLMALSGS